MHDVCELAPDQYQALQEQTGIHAMLAKPGWIIAGGVVPIHQQ